MKITAEAAWQAHQQADILHDRAAVEAGLERLAAAITQRLADKDPVIICVLTGGIVLAGQLLPRLAFPLRLDYIHASRYRGRTEGGELHWIAHPRHALKGETVLLVDDIHDEGHTLAAIVDWCRDQGATEVLSAVLVDKQHTRKHPYRADFVGLEAADRYLFGCGMDYAEYLRNVAEIRALRQPGESDHE